MSAAVIESVFTSAAVPAVVSAEGIGVIARVQRKLVPDALIALRDGEAAFAYLVDLFGVDTGEDIELTYHVRSFARDEDVYVRCRVPYGGETPSVWRVYPAALYPEREAAEMFGIAFPGHPNPKRLLTTDEVEAPLLLRSTPIRDAEEVHDR